MILILTNWFRRSYKLDEPNLGRIQLYWPCDEHGHEGRLVLWYEVPSSLLPTTASLIKLTAFFIVGYPVAWDWIADNIKRAQDYLLRNTTLGIPAIVQTEGILFNNGVPIGQMLIFLYRNSWLPHWQCYDLQLAYWIWKLLEHGGSFRFRQCYFRMPQN